MSHIENYIIGAKIYESDNSLVFRARERQGERPVILKFLRQDYPDPDELARYRQEYEITRSLLSLSDVIEVYDQFANSKSLAMVVEDFGGSSLSLLQAKQQFSLHQALSIGIRVAQALAKVHHHRIIHKDINPNNIVYNLTTDTLKLIDFGISTRLPRQSAKLTNAEKTEGTIAYISPEQTGRMNRYIDHRTDFYSLGITLYELVCGQRPFTEQDSLKLLHCHLAKKPTPPHIVDPSVPVMVSRIIMKLLAKNAEERYTSGWGIASDLQACERGLDATGPEVEFSLAINDHSDRLEIPQKLYGREVELRRLMEIYGRVSAGQTQFVLISGYSGIGKTTLIQELHRPVTLSGGYFISGKFDQLQRIPYSALGQAFAELIHQLLTASESELARWRQRLVAALRTDAQVIVELVPDLALIIGPQAPVEELGAIETRLRFERVMAAFLGVFCQPEHPTVIFIDDLQWADSVSLEILEGLIRSKDLQNLLIVGAYRDNEVNPTHPLMLMQSSLQASNIDLPTMALRDLTTIDIRHLLSDTLRLPTDRTAPLASLLKRKTGGNPFFLNQLLLSLYEEGELTSTFTDNHGAQSWHWDIERIESIRSTDNVVDLMVDKLQQLPDRVQVMLQLSSCLGNTFDLKTLAIIGECSMQDAFANLQPAARAGFIIPLSELTTIPNPEHTPDLVHIDYRFLHDRVQQAAYALIPEIRRRSLHTQSGRLLLSSLDSTAREKRLFEIVDHLNKGIELTDPAEILERATLNLHAAKKAKAATAFEAGRHYVNQAMADLPARCWQDDYAMAIEAASLQVELESVAGHHELAEQLAQQTLERAE
ncbi:MAG: AAA family ATPase, partial [Myxococcota bacterium]